MRASLSDGGAPREGRVPVGNSSLYWRAIGRGRPIIVLHGGPDFDHSYLLPEMDRLAESFRLVYYDQRGRGRSAEAVEPRDVSIESEVDDLDSVRRELGLESAALLGHSWGGLVAMEFATRHPDRVSHLILVNTAPASADDARAFRQHVRRSRSVADRERMDAIRSSAAYRAGDLDAEAEYYRLHFGVALRDSGLLERLVRRLRAHFTEDGVLLARAIEERLYDETWNTDGYDLLPKLQGIDVPTLVLHGSDDFIPLAQVKRIADEMPCARLVVLPDCGHFAPLEWPDRVHEHVASLFGDTADAHRAPG